MQQRRFRPGDVLDDYCPRERRITDHAVVAMIEDHIKQTRCVVCDAEHEYKEGKVPPQRRKRPQAALFTQVLDGLQAPQPVARIAQLPDPDSDHSFVPDEPEAFPVAAAFDESGNGHHVDPPTRAVRPAIVAANRVLEPEPESSATVPQGGRPVIHEEGPVRRPLIRATLPRPEGQPVVTRAMPEFTIRQPNTGRGGQRPGGRRRGGGGHQQQADHGGHRGGRFGRDGNGQQQRSQGGRGQGPHGRSGGSRRGGKKR
jgi:hypothetical protein